MGSGSGPGARPSAASWWRLIGPAVRALRAGRLGAVALGPVTGLLIGSCALAEHLWQPAILTYAASTPWPDALVRLPVSVVAPAEFLPAWGAIAQTVVCLAVAQAVLGLRRTLVVGLAAHLLATLGMRALVHLAAGAVPGFWLHEPDSGPSVAVLAAVAATGLAARADWVAGVVVTGALLEVSVLHNQAGVEHLLGVAIGIVLALAWRVSDARRSAPADTGTPTVAPAADHHDAAA